MGYKYYFKKPKSEIAKDILTWVFIGGAVIIAATSPYFVQSILRARTKLKKYSNKRISDTFTNLRRGGMLNVETRNNQIYISLTRKGRHRAGRFQIDYLEIQKPKQWDRKYRVLIFDISHKKKIKREALRGKLRELGFYPFQKSVWVHAFDCQEEVALLRDFFGLTSDELNLMLAEKIEDDKRLREFFKLDIL